jgi:Carboxypeptidase regulatory-like domain
VKKITLFALFCLVLAIVKFAVAQSTNSGDIRGSVTDPAGALIPGVAVTTLNVETGVTKHYVTDHAGLYDTSSIVPGSYRITFTKTGFQQLVRGPVTILVGFTTVNGRLKVGSTTQRVVVNENVPLLTTESGEQSTTFEAKSMAQLPNVGTDWENFTILLPGTSGNPSSATGGPDNPGQFVAANGNLPYNLILADGSTTTLPSSSNSDVSTFETVSELQVSTSNFSAQYGIGGYVMNQISKGGTSRFRGAAYEYFQNDALNAKGYGFGVNIPVPFLRYNVFGGSISGPVIPRKMFFYFDYEKSDITQNSNGFLTVPTAAEANGDFTGQPTIYDPTTQIVTQTPNGPVVTRRSFEDEYHNGNKIPSFLIDPVARAIQSYYPKPNVPPIISGGVPTNNFYYSVPAPNSGRKFFGRLDYDITPSNRLTISETERDFPTLSPGVGICPIDCSKIDTDSNNAQISDVWNISPQTINEARIGFTDQLNFYVDETLYGGYPAKLGLKFAKVDDFPFLTFSGACCYDLQPGVNAIQKEQVFDFSDVVTMIRGRHVLHFGGELLMYRTDETTWGSGYINSGSFNYTGQYTASTVGDSTTGISYADFLLGQTQSWSANYSPEYGPRMKNPMTFIQDDFKVRPNLTLNLGVRYQIQTGWSDSKNNLAVFDPEVINPATETPGAIWYASTHAHGRTTLQATAYNTILPRFGFSWLPKQDMTIRGGFGVYAYRWSGDVYGAGEGLALQSGGNSTDQTNGISPVVILSSNGSNLPYIGPTTDPAALNGQGVTYNKYHSPVPQIYQWNLAVQHTLGVNMVAQLAYVASHAKNLSFPVDINQVPEDKLGPNDVPSGLPYPVYQSIFGDTLNAISNYNSVQASIEKRLTSGLSFEFNYVWSHFMDDQDSSAYGGSAGTQSVQRSYNPAASYGASNYDVRNAFKGRVVYDLPIGKGRRFFGNNRWLDPIIGGWETSGTIVLSSGFAFTPVIGINNSFSQAGDWYPNQLKSPWLANRNISEWYNPDAYTLPAPGTFGDEHRNSVYGPGLELVNLAAGKSFAIAHGIVFLIRASATNAFNHANFGTPNNQLTPGGPGSTPSDPFFGTSTSITTLIGGGRALQLEGRISF